MQLFIFNILINPSSLLPSCPSSSSCYHHNYSHLQHQLPFPLSRGDSCWWGRETRNPGEKTLWHAWERNNTSNKLSSHITSANPRIELGSQRWKASTLTTPPPMPQCIFYQTQKRHMIMAVSCLLLLLCRYISTSSTTWYQ